MDKRSSLLWHSFRQGSMSAFEQIYQSHYHSLYVYGMKIYSNSEMVRDAIQTLFIDLWRRRDHLGDTDHIKFYLFKGLRRVLISLLKNERKKLDVDSYQHLVHNSMQHDTEDLQDQSLHLKNAVNKLSKKQREVIYLRYYENLSCEEVADIMKININTVYNNLSLAIKNLRVHMDENLLYLLLLVSINYA
ncbi:sigma-70 family RNA polymerase sigma factor [Catalinimonas sp. 4WD22]|uniref:RNA polymerase sigma factor n=1 Tax=Catalinimonas locisalis TaxID=3133978 RepID=UPI0031019DB5